MGSLQHYSGCHIVIIPILISLFQLTKADEYPADEFDAIMLSMSDYDATFNESAAKCDELNLSSTACKDDCIYYNSISNIRSLQNSNDPAKQEQYEYYLTLYAMGANPVGHRDVGSPDMCTFYGGNYCNLPTLLKPAVKQDAAIINHACCLPGSCTGEDAHKVLINNQFCYQQYVEVWPVILKQEEEGMHGSKQTDINDYVIEEICEPLPRELDKAGPWIVFSVFILFVVGIATASLTRHYRMEYLGLNPEAVDENIFLSSFSMQNIWTSFRRTRPPDKSALNFFDGMRFLSMVWVCECMYICRH